MGGRQSRELSISRRVNIYHDRQFFTSYAVTNYHSQMHRLNGIDIITLQFRRRGSKFDLELNYDSYYYEINRQNTFKEGQTLYIDMYAVHTSSTHVPTVFKIPWYDNLNAIQINYDSTVN
jgi:hypothetical protein